jgi:hypothetical protein
MDALAGSPTIEARASVILTGLSATINAGTVTISGDAQVVVTGQSADIILGQYPVWTKVITGSGNTWLN